MFFIMYQKYGRVEVEYRDVLSELKLPDEVSHFVYLVYGQENYTPFSDPKSTKWTNGIVALWSVDKMYPTDLSDYQSKFGNVPKVSSETAPFLIERGYDVFGFIKKGWVANLSTFRFDGYEKAVKEMDKMTIEYQRQLRKEEEKLGYKQESKSTLLERRSWASLYPTKLNEPLLEQIYPTSFGFVIYRCNEIGKITERIEISQDGEIMYQGKFYYRQFKGNYFLYKYENTEGINCHYDTIKNERWKNKGYFG